ncbi:MAG: glycosyltransferase family 1 protein [Alphaproteobacteria bacterium]|nr:glycosyltransferase family 1 protein [Alphaproteobacteria bacterium]
MGLEPYKARYTLQLQDWNETVFKQRGIDYVLVPGQTLTSDQNIVTGQVLDAHGRTYYSLTQMANLVKLMKEGQITSEDVIYFEDMYTSGIDSIPYILKQVPKEYRPKVYVRCLAQTIDPDDFLHVWDMQGFMRKYEEMVNEFVDGVLASNEEMVMHMKVAGWKAPIYNISGLAFGKSEVQGRVKSIKPFDLRKRRVVFAARWDQEKQPDFFMDIVEEYVKVMNGDVEFALLSGAKLRTNNSSYMERTLRLEREGKLKIYSDLDKNEYYELLNDSRVLFNCALQDWVSNTVSEADALGCNVIYPAYRSFPETFSNDHVRMYIPWSQTDALAKLNHAIYNQSPHIGKISDWTDKTIDRICDILEDKGEQWLRMSTDYRKHTKEAKY